MKYIFISFVILIANIGFNTLIAAKEYNNPEFSIQIPETWQAVELDKEGASRSWLFGKQATENEAGVSIAVHILICVILSLIPMTTWFWLKIDG